MRTLAILQLLIPAIATACGVNQTPQPTPPSTLPTCLPNRDGQITAAELPIALGQTLSYYASPGARAVDLVGQDVGGEHLWDLSQENADDTIVALGPVALATQWFAPSFASGQFVVDAGGGLDGVYHQDEQALWLDGTASHDPAPAAGKTLVVYSPPVAVLRFPLADGVSYTTTARLIGSATTIAGLPFDGSDEFDVDVTGQGRVDVPYVNFSPALRVRTHLVRKASSGGAMVSKRTTAFVFECFGEIVHADSKQDEPNADFTTAASLRRFALGEMP
jgi:hypothetical protein